jgi:hypothetical protein
MDLERKYGNARKNMSEGLAANFDKPEKEEKRDLYDEQFARSLWKDVCGSRSEEFSMHWSEEDDARNGRIAALSAQIRGLRFLHLVGLSGSWDPSRQRNYTFTYLA